MRTVAELEKLPLAELRKIGKEHEIQHSTMVALEIAYFLPHK